MNSYKNEFNNYLSYCLVGSPHFKTSSYTTAVHQKINVQGQLQIMNDSGTGSTELKMIVLCLTLSFSLCHGAFLYPPGPLTSLLHAWEGSSLEVLAKSTSDNLCTAPIEPSLSALEMKLFLGPVLGKLESTVKEALHNDSSPGGAVLSFVYRDKVIWTGVYGLKDMESKLASWQLGCSLAVPTFFTFGGRGLERVWYH